MWTAARKRDLIDEIRERPVLWDSSNADYSKKTVTDKNWSEVGALFNCTGTVAKTQWRNLRVYFLDLRRKILATKSGQGLDEVFTPSWAFYTPLLFLVPSVTPRSSRSNLATSTVDDVNNTENLEASDSEVELTAHASSSTTALNPNNVLDQIPGSVSEIQETPNTARSHIKATKRKRAEQEESEKMMELLGAVTDSIKQKPASTNDDHFVSQLLCSLKSIPESRDKELLKLRIMEQVVNLKYN